MLYTFLQCMTGNGTLLEVNDIKSRPGCAGRLTYDVSKSKVAKVSKVPKGVAHTYVARYDTHPL